MIPFQKEEKPNKKKNISNSNSNIEESMIEEIFLCDFEGCGKQYLSGAALYTHKKNKGHFKLEDSIKKTNKGRPRKGKNEEDSNETDEPLKNFYEVLDNMRLSLFNCVAEGEQYEIAKEVKDKAIFLFEDVDYGATNLKEDFAQLQQEFGKLESLVSILLAVANTYLMKYFNLPFLRRYCPLFIEFSKWNLRGVSEEKSPASWIKDIRRGKIESFVAEFKQISPGAESFKSDSEIVECLERYIEMLERELKISGNTGTMIEAKPKDLPDLEPSPEIEDNQSN